MFILKLFHEFFEPFGSFFDFEQLEFLLLKLFDSFLPLIFEVFKFGLDFEFLLLVFLLSHHFFKLKVLLFEFLQLLIVPDGLLGEFLLKFLVLRFQVLQRLNILHSQLRLGPQLMDRLRRDQAN